MSTGFQFDEEASRRVEAIYSTPDVVAQRQAVLQGLELRPGERVLDVGSGPGFLAADMAMAVGDSGRVCGIDISENMVAISRSRCANLSHVEFQAGTLWCGIRQTEHGWLVFLLRGRNIALIFTYPPNFQPD